MKFSQYLFVNKPIRFLLVFAVLLSVLFSCSERGNDLFESENEEEEEFEEGEILKDLIYGPKCGPIRIPK
jgi:hypothetical protein